MAKDPEKVIRDRVRSHSIRKVAEFQRDINTLVDRLEANSPYNKVYIALKLLLDDFLFDNRLRKVRIQAKTNLPDNAQGDCGWEFPENRSRPFGLMPINPEPRYTSKYRSRAEQILGTILHECVHAFLLIELQNNRYPRRLAKKALLSDQDDADQGGDSHGPRWERCSRAVEEAIMDNSGCIVHLGVARSTAFHRNALRERVDQACRDLRLDKSHSESELAAIQTKTVEYLLCRDRMRWGKSNNIEDSIEKAVRATEV